MNDQLNSINNQIDELVKEISQIESEINIARNSGSLTVINNYYRNKINEIIEKTKAIAILDDQWCDVFSTTLVDSDFNTPNIPVDFNSRESVINSIQMAENIMAANKNNVSRDFVEFYRGLVGKQHEFTIAYYNEKLNEISQAYSSDVIQKMDAYKVNGEKFKYNIGGAIYELKDKEDLDRIIGVVEDFENEVTQEFGPVVEYIEPVPLSQTSPEVQARFAQMNEEKVANAKHADVQAISPVTMELNSGTKVTFKSFKNNAKKVIKLIGNKLVATKTNLVNNLREYFAHINIANEDNLDFEFDPMSLPEGDVEYKEIPIEDMDFDQLMADYKIDEPATIIETPKAVEPIITEPIKPRNDKELLLSKYSDLISQRALGKHAGEIKNLSDEEIDFTIDNYLDNLIKVGEEKYGDNFVEDIMNEATSEPIKWLMDEVSQGENLKQVSENTINQIDSMNENELEKYLGELTLSNEDRAEFDKRVNDYIQANPNSSKFIASKEVLKSMANDIDLIKPHRYIQIPEEVTPIIPEPVVIEPEIVSVQPEEKTVDTIDRMNGAELGQYMKDLTLSMDELERFNYLVKQYKHDNPGVSEYMAEKACIKSIMDQREIDEYKVARTSTIEPRK